MKLYDLVDKAKLEQAIADKYINIRYHPEFPLAVLNYSDKTQWESYWVPVTENCRGLVYNTNTLEIVARPFKKFYNFSQVQAAKIELDEPVEVLDKLDGSMICLSFYEGQPVLSTRGSFLSDQAIHAQQIYMEKYHNDYDWFPINGITYIFEVVYKDNRIVVDYGNLDDLVLLAAVDIEVGKVYSPQQVHGWPGPRSETFVFKTLAEALAAEPRKNAEGFVVRSWETGAMIKLKYETYVALHRLVTGLNARVIWERLGLGESIGQICEALPDEFHDWVREVAAELQAKADELYELTLQAHLDIVAKLPKGWARKDYAIAASKSPYRSWIFSVLDQKDPKAAIWKTLKPSAERSLIKISEDTA